MIYFVQALTGGPIKIGYTANVVRRMGELRAYNPEFLLLLGVMEGGRELEREIHRQFQRKQGEWFEPTPLLMEFIARNCEESLRPSPDDRLSSEELSELYGDE